ncbi:phage major tail tube protein [Pseudomonas paralcaligenes]|uniref:phage major tail tube protein n=1 Tax=Pseudomonas paralcaligenes TaxID=2772558 RepID=UPI001C7F9465|nr:phage major tail tube protein [Pseudomonas paralcaligenes]
MALPRKLKHMNMFNDGNSHMGIVASVTLPNLARKIEAYRGGGMPGPVGVDLGGADELMKVVMKLGGWELTALRQYGHPRADGVQLRFAGSVQRDDTGEVVPVEVVMRGRHENLGFGDATPGADTEHEVTTVLSYLKLTFDGRVEIEIDNLNFIFIVDGVDLLAEHRKAIGLA